ncbi:7-cyano-7-deazaguanine reductase [Alteromonadaceae bacterium 2753L.S.0a.02]|nr:7-cyano-7-deazaguanine reductase [Alteromonadaceae bacterium 2753L.S.0a.02]
MSDKNAKASLLGEEASYPTKYTPELLQAIARVDSRVKLGKSLPPMSGVDIWTAYEVSWLTPQGKPQVAIARFVFSSASPAIIESKSFKYYLNSLNQHTFESQNTLQQTLESDLTAACGAPVGVQLFSIDEYEGIARLPGLCVDNLDAEQYAYQPSATLLRFSENTVVNDMFNSHLLKSNCPVTGQPDWASVWIRYSGLALQPQSFLAYVVSFRSHQDFHENCIERMFCDLWGSGKLNSLEVYALYTRRGGLDINPYRSSEELASQPPEVLLKLRIARQ